jgi:hypothetical protein
MATVGHLCPVCGYPDLSEPPRSPSTGGGSYEICPACGFEFGVSDDDEGFSYEQWREKWIEKGMPWRSVSQPKPASWDPMKSLAALQQGSAG